jgi:hypothetical protein
MAHGYLHALQSQEILNRPVVVLDILKSVWKLLKIRKWNKIYWFKKKDWNKENVKFNEKWNKIVVLIFLKIIN